jgi:exodeoxyribonuclease VII large subunit
MSMMPLFPERRILTVTEINQLIKGTLEGQFGEVWVQGEISNLRIPASGHVYFTLKDAQCQLRTVCFKPQIRMLKFKLEDGLAVLVRGHLTVYEPRGDYQLIADTMEPQGLGSLQLAFEQLKARLQKEGLFDPERKRKLPLLPRKIAVVTSSTGAAIRDILRVLHRRNRSLHVLIYPVKVQGTGAAQEIAAGIRYLNTFEDIDVIITGRGGGSIEDLWAFNEEPVARAIFQSRIPVISAVGHEIDFTIADMVADLRAPTPSAAAEMVSGVRAELQQRIDAANLRLQRAVSRSLADGRQRLQLLSGSRAFKLVESRIQQAQQRVDDLGSRAAAALKTLVAQRRSRHAQMGQRLEKVNPLQVLQRRRAQLTLAWTRLRHAILHVLEPGRTRLQGAAGKLDALSPLAILARGYAICQDARGHIVTDASRVAAGDPVSVRLSQGSLDCRVSAIRK